MGKEGEKMETGGKELLQLIGVHVPDPSWIRGSPKETVEFGKHFGTYRLNEKTLKWELFRRCCSPPGDLIYTEYLRYPNAAPFAVKCSKCGLILNLYAKNWKEFVLEWMMIALGTFWKEIENENKLKTRLPISQIIRQNIKICIPHKSEIFQGGLPGYGTVQWNNYGIVTEMTPPYDIDEYYALLLVCSGILMTEIEKIFQNSINHAASISERFHPDTQREKEVA
jgi:hypothetical protein